MRRHGDRAAPAPSPSVPPTRRYDGPQGVVDLPLEPRRVVTMYPTDTDIALALGLPVVAAPGATGSALQPFAAYQAQALDGVQRITAGFEPAPHGRGGGLRPDRPGQGPADGVRGAGFARPRRPGAALGR